MEIITYSDYYRDDLIFMVLEAKNALGRIPSLNEDLLDITHNYIEKNDNYYLVIENNRVIASCGYHMIGENNAKLQRFYVKHNFKNKGIGTLLYLHIEKHLKSIGFKEIVVHLGEPKSQWFESYAFYTKQGFEEVAVRIMRKKI